MRPGDRIRTISGETIEESDQATVEGSEASKGVVGGGVCAQSKVNRNRIDKVREEMEKVD